MAPMEDVVKAIHTDDKHLLRDALPRVGVNNQDPNMGNAAAINVASFMGKAEMVDEILRLRASPDTQDDRGASPLILSVVNGHAGCVDMLVAARANPNLADKKGAVPVILSSFNGDAALTKKLLAAGANVRSAPRAIFLLDIFFPCVGFGALTAATG